MNPVTSLNSLESIAIGAYRSSKLDINIDEIGVIVIINKQAKTIKKPALIHFVKPYNDTAINKRNKAKHNAFPIDTTDHIIFLKAKADIVKIYIRF